MKIHEVSQLPAPDRRISEKSPTPNAPGFQQLFHHMFERVAEENPASAAVVHSSSPPPLTVNAIEPLHATSGVQAMERLIDSLDDYQNRLENPQNTLRDIEPALERLERDHGELSHWASQTSGDNPLKSIINEGLVVATLEIGRFRSGVYC